MGPGCVEPGPGPTAAARGRPPEPRPPRAGRATCCGHAVSVCRLALVAVASRTGKAKPRSLSGRAQCLLSNVEVESVGCSRMNDSRQTRGSKGLSGDLDMTRMEWELLAFDISVEFDFHFWGGEGRHFLFPGTACLCASSDSRILLLVVFHSVSLFAVCAGVCFCRSRESCTSLSCSLCPGLEEEVGTAQRPAAGAGGLPRPR